MSVDFVARALARQQQSGSQAPSFTTLATGIPGVQIPAGVKVLQTSGYSADGNGVGAYVSDSLATAALASAHPRFCKADAGGRFWRLLPDDNDLIPVACGGAAGFEQFTEQRLNPVAVVSTTGYAAFGGSPWSVYAGWAFSSAGIPGPDGTGSATLCTAPGNWCGDFTALATGHTYKMIARVKAGTGARFILFSSPSVGGGGVPTCSFDLGAGTIAHDDFGTGRIASLGSGWYQVEATIPCLGYMAFGESSNDGFGGSLPGDTMIVHDVRIYETYIYEFLASQDDRAAIQAAIEYAEAIGAAGTRYDATNYPLRRTHRDVGVPFNPPANLSGTLLRTTRSHRFISTCGGTTLWRREADGSAMGKAKFDTMPGYYWRGGGIYVGGQTSDPGDPSAHSIHLRDIVLDGGITDSSEQNNPHGPNMNFDGDGWDISDKGIWQSNDRYCGHIVLEGRSGIRYFMGELIYSSGVGAASADRHIAIGPDVDLGHTCGSCLNANGATMQVERCSMHHAYMGIEGWTGHAGGYLKAVISDTNRNTIQGGIPHFGAGGYYEKTRPVAGVLPIGQLDVLLRKAGAFEVGSYLYGRIESIDCAPSLGNLAAFPNGCQDVDLDIVTWADQVSLTGAVNLLGGSSGYMSTDRVTLRVTPKRTDDAAANGRGVGFVYCYGSFGPEVVVTAVGGSGAYVPNGAVFDNAFRIMGATPDFAVSNYYDIEANNNAILDILNRGNVIGPFGTNSGSYNMNLPTTGIPKGFRLFIRNKQPDISGADVVCRIPGANLRGKDLLIPRQDYGFAAVEWDGYRWHVAIAPTPYAVSKSWDPASVASGASATTTLVMAGAVLGDKVEASFSLDLQGMVLSAYVSAAWTVTAVLFNPTGSAINLASGTLTATIG